MASPHKAFLGKSARKTRSKSSGASTPSGELSLIAAIRSQVASSRVRHAGLRLGIGDDCAILCPPAGHDVAVTTDFSLETVHFRRDWHPPESVGHRCLARGLSDLAAMGAKPLGAFLSIALPPELTEAVGGKSWFARFLDGFLALADKERVPLAGGDTAKAPTLARSPGLAVADITLVGAVPRRRALFRSAARVGDVIYVTGALGGSAAELLALEESPKAFAGLTAAAARHPHLYPQPRLTVARRLCEGRRIHAGIDLSDGLSSDLAHLCRESGVAAELDTSVLPIHTLAREAERAGHAPSARGLALHGGEDYELLFTAPRGTKVPRTLAGVSLHPIGEMVKPRRNQPLVTLRETDGNRTALEAGGWEHFRRS